MKTRTQLVILWTMLAITTGCMVYCAVRFSTASKSAEYWHQQATKR
jgi:heme/copper-type cytochrome/quinol oxidase subunit 2